MKRAIARRWAAALRNDKYKQGQGCLKKKENDGTASHCCLGVLTELYQASMRRQGKRGLKERDIGEGVVGFSSSCRNALPEEAIIPPAVVKWASMQTDTGDYPCSAGTGSLVEDNDYGKSFRQIARIIEKHAEDL